MNDPFPTPKKRETSKRILSPTYDRKKPVVLIGKGPSARYVRSSEKHYTCCLNSSGRMTDIINFQFLGDHQVFKQFLICDGYLDKIENFIFPVEFNQDNPGRKLSTELIGGRLPKKIKKHQYTFNFHRYPETDDVRMYTVISTGELALAWLLDEGFREFYTVGVDPYAPDNVRHHVFEMNREGVGNYPNNPGGMIISYNRMMKRVNLYGASMRQYKG